MSRSKDGLMQHRAWLAALAVVAGLSLLLAFAPGVQAEEKPQLAAHGLAQSQIFNDDLTVRAGQVIDGDVVVYSGDVEIDRDGKIIGNLTVYSGDVDIAEGGMVDGNLTSWSGDVSVDGRVDGSISAVSGNVELGDKAIVGGDISSMSGRIKQRAGASVSGSILHGPDLKLPAIPGLSWMRNFEARVPSPVHAPSMVERVINFFGRILVALLMLGLAVFGAAGLVALRSQWILDVHSVLGRQTALSFAAGLLVNVLVVAVAGVLYFTVCLRPPALLLGLGLVGLNVAGWAAVGYEIGGKVGSRTGGQWSPVARTGVGLLIPGAVIAFLWVMGGCLAFFAFLGALLISSFGAGAVLVHVLKLGSTPATPSTPVPSAAATVPPVTGTPVEQAPMAERTAESPVDVPAAETPAVPVTRAVVTPPVVAEVVVEPPPVAPAATPALEADFTSIPGIGAKLNQRLHEAGVRTFADLAAQSPEALAVILGWSAERVTRSGIIEQAKITAAAGQ